MASNTENLNLLMKNPSTDGADTFNIQTMLNENWQKIDNNAGTVAQTLANILKPTTPPIIGLPPSTTPDGMFQALGNTGELHVWRKTVTTAQEIPAGYTLGPAQSVIVGTASSMYGTQHETKVSMYASSSITVYDNGYVALKSPTSDCYGHVDGGVNDSMKTIIGKFFYIYEIGEYITAGDIAIGDIYFVPSDAEITCTNYSTRTLSISKAQKVNAYPLTPAGTTTTYPVSTNPNAYQEGSDAKEAGYTVGEVVSGSFYMGIPRNSYQNTYTYSSSLSVSDDGTISLANPSTATSSQWSPLSTDAINSTLVGKFVQWTCQDPNNLDTKYPFNASPSPIIFIPSDAKITVTTPDSNERFTLSKYQPVTGYAAIPAGTTIEYLGKLGDKARVQVVSYVGTGTYGSSNPNSLTFDFVPKVVMLFAEKDSSSNYRPSPNSGGWTDMFIWLAGMHGTRIASSDVYFTLDRKKLSWYAYSSGANYQCNNPGSTYIAVAIG